HDLRLDEVELVLQVWRARLDLVRHGVAVHRRPALQHVGDVDVAAAQRDAGKQRVEKLAGRADERLTLTVLVEPWSLADHHHVSRAWPHPGDGLRPGRVQPAVLAGPDGLVELVQLRGQAKRLSPRAWRR